VKLFGGQKAISGNIILRQKGNKFWAAEGTATGRDFTIYEKTEGRVKFKKKKKTRFDGRVKRDIYFSIVK